MTDQEDTKAMVLDVIDDTELNARQAAFVIHYVTDAQYNATKAAKLAGYTGSTLVLTQTGSQNLTNPHISKAVDMMLGNLAMRESEAVYRLAAMARADMGDFVDDHGRADMGAIKENGFLVRKLQITRAGHITIELHDSMKALGILMKHLHHKDALDAVPTITENQGVLLEQAVIVLQRIGERVP